MIIPVATCFPTAAAMEKTPDCDKHLHKNALKLEETVHQMEDAKLQCNCHIFKVPHISDKRVVM